MKFVFGELYDLRLTILRIKMVWMYEQKKKSLIENVISRQSGIQTVRVIEILPGILGNIYIFQCFVCDYTTNRFSTVQPNKFK